MITDNVLLRAPNAEEGLEIQQLINTNPPLDTNSAYNYYLLCKHFADTCIVAEHEGKVAGFLSAYLIPGRPDTLFVWQVVVDKSLRGKRVAARMLDTLITRCSGTVHYIEATVNPSNTASRSLFESLARQHGTTIKEEKFLEAEAFGPAADHESEILLHIPLDKNFNRNTGEQHANI